MLSNTLNTNEIKNKAGTEVEFSRLSTSDRKTVFAQVGETPSAPHRLSIAHTESGVGSKSRRRSLVRFDKTFMGTDGVTPVTASAYMVLDLPVGSMANLDEAANVTAELLSFCATTGAATTVLFDGTGNGASAAINGGL